jgi:hypothetical protein
LNEPRRVQTIAATTMPAIPPARNAPAGPLTSTRIPAADWPAESPSVAAVMTQPNASVAVPGDATASTPSDWAVTCGVMVAPANSIATTSTGIEASGPVRAMAATHMPNAASSTGSRRCSGRGHGRSE